MKKSNPIYSILALLGCLLAMPSCQSEDKYVDKDQIEIPVTFLLQSSGIEAGDEHPSGRLGENPTFKNPRELYTDRIELNVYRRPEGIEYNNNYVGFKRIQVVNMTCYPVKEGVYVRKATGFLNLSKGYEYRTTAIAYSEKENEKSLFNLEHGQGDPFHTAFIQLKDEQQFKTPELFFGTPRSGATPDNKDGGTEIFTAQHNSDAGLFGVLYRCVAGIELTLTEVPDDVKSLALLAGKMNTECPAVEYFNFKTPTGLKENHFLLVEWNRPDNMKVAEEVKLIGANLLAIKDSPLYVKVTKNDNTSFVIHLRLKEKEQAGTGPDASQGGYPEGGSGTGIIPGPGTGEQPDQPTNPYGDLSFERNHYYRISGSYNQFANSKLPLVVTINPIWDGDHELDMDKK